MATHRTCDECGAPNPEGHVGGRLEYGMGCARYFDVCMNCLKKGLPVASKEVP